MSTFQAHEGRPQPGSSGAYWSGGDCLLHGEMNKFMDEKVLRKTLEEIILKNGVATPLTHPMATVQGRNLMVYARMVPSGGCRQTADAGN